MAHGDPDFREKVKPTYPLYRRLGHTRSDGPKKLADRRLERSELIRILAAEYVAVRRASGFLLHFDAAAAMFGYSTRPSPPRCFMRGPPLSCPGSRRSFAKSAQPRKASPFRSALFPQGQAVQPPVPTRPSFAKPRNSRSPGNRLARDHSHPFRIS